MLPEGRYTGRIRAADGGVPSKSTDEVFTVIVGSSNTTLECPVFASSSRTKSVTILETHDPQVRKIFLAYLLTFDNKMGEFVANEKSKPALQSEIFKF